MIFLFENFIKNKFILTKRKKKIKEIKIQFAQQTKNLI